MFRFASPYFLLLLVLIPMTIRHRLRRIQKPALAGTGMGSAEPIKRSFFLRIARLMPLLIYLAMVLMIIALARPQSFIHHSLVPTTGVNIVLAIDLSESMAAKDFYINGEPVERLDAVKTVVRDFIRHRAGDRIGMVVFGSHAYTQLPLTRDYGTITTMLEGLKIGAAGNATAIGDAIGISLKRLEDIESRTNIILLLTDGCSNSGEFPPPITTAIAMNNGVKIYTVGVGSQDKMFVKFSPERHFIQYTEFDEPALQEIADQTGGRYFNAKDLEGLKQVCSTIDRMEKTEVKIEAFDQFNELYIYLLLPAFGLLGAWMVLVNTRFLQIP